MEDLVARARRWSAFNFGDIGLGDVSLRKGVEDLAKSLPDGVREKIQEGEGEDQRAAAVEAFNGGTLKSVRDDETVGLSRAGFEPDWFNTHALGHAGRVVDATSILKAEALEKADDDEPAAEKPEASEAEKEVKREEAKGKKPAAAPTVPGAGIGKSTEDIVSDLRKTAEGLLKAEEQATTTTDDVSFTPDNWGKVIGRAGLSHKDATKASSVWVWSAPGIRISSTYNPATQTAPGGAPMTSGMVTLSGDKSKVEMCFKDVEKYSSKVE